LYDTIRGLPSEVVLHPDDDPISHSSVVSLDSVESVSVAVLVDRIGSLSGARMREICSARQSLSSDATHQDQGSVEPNQGTKARAGNRR